jgi:CRISPR-associated protein Cas2
VLVVLANDLPPAVRGRIKLWFTEPRPNVFVSGINDSVAEKVIDYLFEHCLPESGVMVFQSLSKPPGYKIFTIGPTRKKLVELSGLQLVVETLKTG